MVEAVEVVAGMEGKEVKEPKKVVEVVEVVEEGYGVCRRWEVEATGRGKQEERL
jgi:hypothetical protein